MAIAVGVAVSPVFQVSIVEITIPGTVNNFLLEDGFFFLLEDGCKLILEEIFLTDEFGNFLVDEFGNNITA